MVDAPADHIARIATEVRPDFIQAHGSETAQEVSEISTRTGIPVIKAIAIGDADDFAKARVFHDAAAMILFDTKAPPTLAGGLRGAMAWPSTGNSAERPPFPGSSCFRGA